MFEVEVVGVDQVRESIALHPPDYILSALSESERSECIEGVECSNFPLEQGCTSPNVRAYYESLPWANPSLLSGNSKSVSDLVSFGKDLLLRQKPCHILLHCQLGISRSPALALILLALDHGNGEEQAAVHHLHSICPCSIPNEEVVALGDAAMGLGGRLINAWRNEFYPNYQDDQLNHPCGKGWLARWFSKRTGLNSIKDNVVN